MTSKANDFENVIIHVTRGKHDQKMIILLLCLCMIGWAWWKWVVLSSVSLETYIDIGASKLLRNVTPMILMDGW